jgi:putative FmdB family regulatory protein
MPLYEYRCEKCGHVSAFYEKMFQRPKLFFGRRKCQKCGSRKLVKILSRAAGHVERTQTEMMNELKSMGNVQFVPDTRPKGPPGGVCPYEASEKAQAEKAGREKAAADKKAREPIVIS